MAEWVKKGSMIWMMGQLLTEARQTSQGVRVESQAVVLFGDGDVSDRRRVIGSTVVLSFFVLAVCFLADASDAHIISSTFLIQQWLQEYPDATSLRFGASVCVLQLKVSCMFAERV